MPAINKIAKIVGKTAENMKTGSKAIKDIKAAGKDAKGKLTAMGADKMSKKDIAATVRGATASVRKTTGLPGPGKVGAAAGTAATVAGVGALAAANREKGAAKATSTVSKPVTKPSGKPDGQGAPAVVKPSGKPSGKPDGQGAPINPGKPEKLRSESTGVSSTRYRAKKGDSMWSIAEKTAPKGTSTAAWWNQIKKLNQEGGQTKRLYSNTAVRLPKGATVTDGGYGDSGMKNARRENQ
jgi:hypothetical protein